MSHYNSLTAEVWDYSKIWTKVNLCLFVLNIIDHSSMRKERRTIYGMSEWSTLHGALLKSMTKKIYGLKIGISIVFKIILFSKDVSTFYI